MSMSAFYIYTYVGLSALLVSTRRAMRRPIDRGTSDRTGSTFFFVYAKIIETCQLWSRLTKNKIADDGYYYQ